MRTKRIWLVCLAGAVSVSVLAAERTAATSEGSTPQARVRLLASGLRGASGSAIGPDGALYATEGETGSIQRIDPRTGRKTTFASGLPTRVIPLGGAMDVAFIGHKAYALVTLVGEDVGGGDTVGIYAVNGPNHRVVADLGAFSIAHPPAGQIDVPSGLQYALDVYRGDFLVTDGHHNRVLRARRDGTVSEAIAFDNIVPTGLAVAGAVVFLAQAGPTPHRPEDGRIVAFAPGWPFVANVASGAPLLVDVEFGRGFALYALSQGTFPEGGLPAEPALPNTGALLRVRHDGTLKVVVDGLNQPTSVEFIGDTAYVVTLGGEIWTLDLGHHRRW
jgi:sugar lactone lactonase YvrE